MFGNRDGRIFRDIAGNLLGALFHDEAAEAAKIDVVVVGQRRLDALHESLDDGLHLHLLDTGALSDFAYDICLCHVFIVLKIKLIHPLGTANIRFICILANKPQFFFAIFNRTLRTVTQRNNKYRAKPGREPAQNAPTAGKTAAPIPPETDNRLRINILPLRLQDNRAATQ